MEIFLIACLGVLVVSAMTLGNRATARAQEWTAACAEYERKKEAGTAMKVADMQELALLADFRCELQELLEKVNDQGLNTVLSVEFSSDAQTLSVQGSAFVKLTPIFSKSVWPLRTASPSSRCSRA